MNKINFRIRILALVILGITAVILTARPVLADAGIWESYIEINSTYYDANATTSNPVFDGSDLGIFVPGSIPLVLNGGEIKTFKNNGSDILGAKLYYRVYPVGSPGISFLEVNLPWSSNLSAPGDQKWATSAAAIDLLNGLSDDDYTLEVYYQVNTNNVDAANPIYDNNGGSNYTATFTVASSVTLSDKQALWLDQATMGWHGTTDDSYKLLYDPDGAIVPAVAGATACAFPAPATSCYVTLTESGTISGYAKNPNATGLTRLTNTLAAADVKYLLAGQTAVASYNSGGTLIDISGIQIQSVLDALYATNAASETLGISYSGGAPTLKVWAPTAQNVTLYKFEDASTTTSTTHPLTLDSSSGVWSVTGAADWNRDYYLLGINVYVPSEDSVALNMVTDPYAITLSADSSDMDDPRSQFVNLDDSDLKPTDWDSLAKPTLNAFEDITVYEMHIRDFSINDSTVASTDRGTYMGFTYDGAGPDPETTLSDGMAHLLALRDAGLSHVHLMPTFDIASVNEDAVPRTIWPNPTGNPRDSEAQQTAVSTNRADDGFNWGYDPYHYGAVEGSYSTDATDGTQRILEFRRMVSALNQNDMRVVMDVVYNHTAASGQDDKSVLDKIVPGYYYRYDVDGEQQNSSCCSDTATEYAMMEKLMIDTLVRFAVDYKIDGFRFDLMNLHTRQNMLNVQTAIQSLTPGSDGVDGSKIYLYGEGWDFGSSAEKGLTNCPNCYAKQSNMTGTGIGTFNDRLRDAAHGGYSTDSLQIRTQGFINGLSYDWNGYTYPDRYQSNLHTKMDILRSALRASGVDWNGQGNPYTADPQESVPYVSKHDNETLFDQNMFKLPSTVTMADRVRAQNMGTSLVGLSQGIPFFHMGSDIMRSKSLDRNSYDSGDWFNRVFWDKSSNNFGQGAPPAWDNSGRWDIMKPLLADNTLDPTTADMNFSAAHMREILSIRQSSPLFRLQTEAEVNAQVNFYNGSNSQDGLLVMSLSDDGGVDLDTSYETILVFFNANKIAQDVTISGANGFSLHPEHTDGIDDDSVLTSGSSFDDGTDVFTIPARTTAVFVSPNLITPPPAVSTLDFVGRMWPRGGVVASRNEGAAASGVVVTVQVYEPGVTDAAGQGSGISCTLHWGQYGQVWNDVSMSFNADVGNNDEYVATLSPAVLNGLTAGQYGFTTNCQKTGEDKKWKQDLYDIDSAGDDDQGNGLFTIIPSSDPSPAPAGGTFAHLFEWKWTDIEKECSYLAEVGYSAVQVSPPNEHLVPTANQGGDTNNQFPWWVRYQPVTHDVTKFTSRSGTLTEFQNMVDTCNNLGIDVYVDAVINHTADIEVGAPPAGTFGTQYESGMPGRYYGTQYDAADFYTDCTINEYADRGEVQTCQLSGLPDLATEKTAVQTKLHDYLQDLIDMGVAGFRIDGSKHIAAHELNAILDGLTGNPYIFQEVIDTADSERIRDWEYIPNGDVTEFAYSINAMSKFNTGNIADLETLPTYTGMMPSQFAVVFTDNHDNQRGHGPGGSDVVDHRDGGDYDLANIFMLAYPYGYPKVMSSYYWSNNPASDAGDSYGPPSTNDGGTTWGVGLGSETRPVYGAGQVAGDDPANCNATYEDGKWVCEHRRASIANMVGFRLVTAGETVVEWWDNTQNQLAFGLGSKGYVAINREGSDLTHTFQTNMSAGNYCDVIHGELSTDGTVCSGPVIVVNGSGEIINQTVAAMSSFAIHAESRLGAPILEAFSEEPSVSFNASTPISATIRTFFGRPVPGVTVSFVLADGAGSLSAASATTNAQGVASVVYTAPSTFTVAEIEAGITALDTIIYANSAFVYAGANTVAQAKELAVTDPFSLGDVGTFGVTITKNGSRTTTVGVARMDGDICGGSSGNGYGAAGPFVDVMLENATNITSVEMTVAYTLEDAVEESNYKLFWCDRNGQWQDISASPTPDTNANTVTFIVTNDTTPSLSQLTGTPFVIGSPSAGAPLAVTLNGIQVNDGMGETAVFLSLLLLVALSLSVFALRRKKST